VVEKDFTKSQMTDRTGIQLRQIPSDLAIQFLMVSWKITKKNYEAVLQVSVLYTLILAAMSYTPFVKMLAPLPATILGAGFMVFARKITLGDRGSVKDLFVVFEDNQKMGELLPIGLLGVGIALLQALIQKSFPSFIGNLLGFALTLLLVALTTFSAPLIYFKQVQAIRSIELNLQATSLSWQFLLALGLMLAGLAVVCTIALVIPVLLVFLPVALVVGYLTYAALFEGLDIKEVDRKF
jgi:hypothetical protein